MNANRIVFPTDFSADSNLALEHAVGLARDTRAKLLIVHVEEPPLVYGDVELNPQAQDHEAIEKMLSCVVPASSDIPFEHHLLSGSPADEIVRFADAEQADLIILGSHGRTGLRRVLMGSVAEAIVRRANCPVLIFKYPHPIVAK